MTLDVGKRGGGCFGACHGEYVKVLIRICCVDDGDASLHALASRELVFEWDNDKKVARKLKRTTHSTRSTPAAGKIHLSTVRMHTTVQ